MQETKYYIYEFFLPNGKVEKGLAKNVEFSPNKITYSRIGYFDGMNFLILTKTPNNKNIMANIACVFTETTLEDILSFANGEKLERLKKLV